MAAKDRRVLGVRRLRAGAGSGTRLRLAIHGSHRRAGTGALSVDGQGSRQADGEPVVFRSEARLILHSEIERLRQGAGRGRHYLGVA